MTHVMSSERHVGVMRLVDAIGSHPAQLCVVWVCVCVCVYSCARCEEPHPYIDWTVFVFLFDVVGGCSG